MVTSDNPRSEDPRHIIDEILAGMPGATPSHACMSSRTARARSPRRSRDAQHGDVVLIAGKGHENYQEIAGERLPFSDVAVAQQARCEAWA